ncbi:hypothetical protein [Bacillus sp. Marseille-Q3570]|uniref:hypothetical protein n=1 Tax=Bacillus sp. Marseille-Q3570 TaxID=2963522 RepID=UPI0021B6FF1E|nr:hypothetical protein [Bacillus sp. Marseille-Q3570]
MKKGLISLLGGIILGVLVSFLALDYKGSTLNVMGKDNVSGEPLQKVQEIDIDVLMNGLLIVAGISIFIYLIWAYLEKRT